jgi:hypothetical protein
MLIDELWFSVVLVLGQSWRNTTLQDMQNRTLQDMQNR